MNKQSLYFLGDIHGELSYLIAKIKVYDLKDCNIIQCGDFGVGFTTFEKNKRWLSLYNPLLKKKNIHLYVVRGNHDYPAYYENDPFELSNIHLVKDYTILNLNNLNILCLGGAVSIDKTYRFNKNQRGGIYENLCTESWWSTENFVYDEKLLNEIRDVDIVVSHTAPSFCEPFIKSFPDRFKTEELLKELDNERDTVTNAFNILKQNNNIKYHIYGHFHDSYYLELDGTIYRGLNINELYNITDDDNS